jgi:hypothetical protein
MTTSALATLSPEKPTKPTNPDIMQNEFANRQNMHLTVLKLLDSPEYQGAWKNQKPTVFTTRAAELRPLVNSLTDLIAAQQTATTGYAETKEREEQELETLAHEISQTLADWYEEQGREGDSAQIDLSLNAWQRLRDTELIAKARLLHQKLTQALASDAAALAEHDLTPADATQLAKELADFEAITADPAAAISRRRSLTVTLRPRFREISELLKKMDRLVLRFRKTKTGAAFASAWTASRIVRDQGESAPPVGPEPTPPSA